MQGRRLAVLNLDEQPRIPPEETRVTRFLPDLNRARGLGWVERSQSSSFLLCDDLAKRIVIEFVDLVQRFERTGRDFPLRPVRLRRRPR
jgi:hypothetical protein